MKEEIPPLLVYEHYEDGTVIVYSPYSNKPPKIRKGEPLIEQPPVRKRTCRRCDYSWTPRKKQKPAQCPRCKSCYWNRERMKK